MKNNNEVAEIIKQAQSYGKSIKRIDIKYEVVSLEKLHSEGVISPIIPIIKPSVNIEYYD